MKAAFFVDILKNICYTKNTFKGGNRLKKLSDIPTEKRVAVAANYIQLRKQGENHNSAVLGINQGIETKLVNKIVESMIPNLLLRLINKKKLKQADKILIKFYLKKRCEDNLSHRSAITEISNRLRISKEKIRLDVDKILEKLIVGLKPLKNLN